jgi:hydroxylamine reductase (hybrid-cluster protein)
LWLFPTVDASNSFLFHCLCCCRLGPRLPAFLTPDAVKQLVDAFAIQPANTEDPAMDLKQMMSNH